LSKYNLALCPPPSIPYMYRNQKGYFILDFKFVDSFNAGSVLESEFVDSVILLINCGFQILALSEFQILVISLSQILDYLAWGEM
jgi:hypothetical protein